MADTAKGYLYTTAPVPDPTGHPFVGRKDALPSIWSYGHRNPQGLTLHPYARRMVRRTRPTRR